MQGQMGRNGRSSIPTDFHPQQLSLFIISGSFVLENESDFSVFSFTCTVLASRHSISYQNEDGHILRVKETGKQ